MPLYPQISARNGRFAAGNAARNAGLVPPYGGVDLITALTHLGLSDNLRLCLDAGDSSSYSSGQSWLDRSGNGYDFFRGATSGATTDDPTFNGSAGAHTSSEYWSFDGGDFFQYDTTNETWMDNLHKDNAVFTLMAWVYPASFSANQALFTTHALSSNIGIRWTLATAGVAQIGVGNGSVGTVSNGQANSPGITAATWGCLGLSLNEPTGRQIGFGNGRTTIGSATYTSPSASSAGSTARIGATGNLGNPFLSGSRIAMFMAWEGKALTISEMTAVYQATRNRFGV